MKTHFKQFRLYPIAGIEKRFVFAILLLISTASCRTIRPEGPLSQNPPDTAPVDQKLSFASVPLEVNLDPVFTQANNSLDRQWSKSENPCQGVRYNATARREDLRFDFTNIRLNVETKLFYGASATLCTACAFGNCIVPKVSASCGVNGESERIVNIAIGSDVSILPDYRLNIRSQLLRFDPENRCRIFVINFDVTDRIIGAVRPRFEQLLGQLDQKVAGISIRGEVEKIWSKLQQPMTIDKVGFLKLNPQSLGLAALSGQGTKLTTRIELSAFPSISPDNQPGTNVLPDLTTPQHEDSFNIQFDIIAQTDSLSSMLTKNLAGKSISVGYRKFAVRKCEVLSLSNGRVALKIDFGGWRKGYIYLVGTPTVDPEGTSVSFPDLQFDTRTNSLLLNASRWILNKKITDMIRECANFNFTPQLTNVKLEATARLNEPWGDNVMPSGSLDDVTINGIFPLRNRILFRSNLRGKLSISLSNASLSLN